MLLLTEPYGYKTRGSVSILLKSTVDFIEFIKLEDVLKQFSCHEPAIPKIYSCLMSSGQYSCWVQLSWFKDGHKNLSNMLSEIGIKLKILETIN